MNILQALEQLNPQKIHVAEEINYYLREKEYDLRHSTFNLSTLEAHKKQLQALKNIINISDNIVSYLKANQSNMNEFHWENVDDEIYDYVFNLRNLMIRYQREFGKKNEWICEAA